MKAYKVENPYDDEGQMVIVHADKPSQAKAFAQGEFSDWYDFRDLRATRAPEFDALVGDDLIRAQLEAGWWMRCMGKCTDDVRSEKTGEPYDEGAYLTPLYVLRNGDVYCSTKCCLERMRSERDTRMRVWKACQVACERWPGITDLTVWGTMSAVHMTFSFPGGEYPAAWDGKEGFEGLEVMQSDLEAWEAFVAPIIAARAGAA